LPPMMRSKLRFAASINHAPTPPEHKFGEAVSLSSQCVLHTADGATFVPHSSPQTTGLVGTTRHYRNRKAIGAFWRSRLYLSGIPAEIVSSLPVGTPHRRQIGICSAASSEKTAGTHAWHLCCWLGS
jgi:hypothetical protein